MTSMMAPSDPRWMSWYMQHMRKRGQSGGAPPVALPSFDYLVVLGSSTSYEVYGGNTKLGWQTQNVRKAVTDAGYDVPVISKAVSGSTIATLDANVTAYLNSLGAISAADPSKVAVIINIGSNDITLTDYDDKLPAERDAMLAGLISIVAKVTAFGFTPILSTSNSRKGSELLYQEWAEKFYRPAIQAHTPFWFLGPNAVFDYSQFYFENKDVPNWWQVDNTHPWMATIPMQQHTIAQLASKSILPPIAATKRVIFSFPQQLARIGGVNEIQAAASATATSVYDTNGNLISGATFGWTGAGGGSASVRLSPGNHAVDLNNTAVFQCNLYALTATITFTANFGVAYANKTGTLRASSNASTAGRLTKFVVGANNVIVNASAAGLQVGELPFALDASGVLVFTALPQSPSTYSNIAAIEMVFNP